MYDHLAIELEILGNACVAAVLGGAIGWEREMARRPAGARTLMLVCISATMLMMLGSTLATEFQSDIQGSGIVTTDPARVLQGIVSGVSFIGAGVIFTSGREGTVEGVTTAATILITTAIGVAIASHYYVLAIGITALALIVLTIVGRIEARAHPREPGTGG